MECLESKVLPKPRRNHFGGDLSRARIATTDLAWRRDKSPLDLLTIQKQIERALALI